MTARSQLANPVRQEEKRSQIRLTQDECELIRLAQLWQPFGGPPEAETFERLGLWLDDYRQRLADINRRAAAQRLS